MPSRFSRKSLFIRSVSGFVLVSFIVTSMPIRSYADSSFSNADKLRTRSMLEAKDGGERILGALHVDLFARQRQTLASMPATHITKVYGYERRKGYDVVARVDKKALIRLIEKDEVGLIEDEDKPGQYIWARKIDGAVVTKNGDLAISGRIIYPTMADVPLDRITLNRYAKVIPLAYNFFKLYRANGEFAWLSDIIAEARVLLAPSGTLGDRHFSADKDTKTIKIEKNFLDYLMQGGQKRVGMGLFAEAAIALSDKEISPEKAKEIVDRIAQVSLTGKNRLEDAIYLFNLIKEITHKSRTNEARKLTSEERKYFLIDVMERNRGIDGRKAAELLRDADIGDGKKLGFYGKVTALEAENDLKQLLVEFPLDVVVDIYKKDENKPPVFRLSGKHLADASLIEGRDIVPDFIVTDRDTSLFGGKTAYTGMMQWLPEHNTMPMFATAGRCFMDLVKYNNYTEEFFEYDKALQDGLASLDVTYNKEIKELGGDIKAQNELKIEDVKQKQELIKHIADKFQSKLEWGVAKVPPQLVAEIKTNLDTLAKSLGVPVYLLMLAIRSSAVGEDSETASFAGRQDTSLFVSYLHELFKKLDVTPERFGYTWGDFSKKVFPWYDILNRLRQEVGEQELNDAMYDVFIKEWLANQRSLFNERSIAYRLEMGMPVFTEDAAMSSLFQQMGLTEYGFVAFSVNRASGYPENQIELIEGQINPLVDGSGTGDLIFVEHEGRKPLRRYKIPDSRQVWHVPGIIFDTETLLEQMKSGETAKGGVFVLPFPEELKGQPAISDRLLLTQLGRALTGLSKAFGMFSDMEGGLVVRRDKNGKAIPVEDLSEPDGIAKDHLGKPRMQMIQFMTQIRPETTFNFKNPDIIELNYKQVTEDSIKKARDTGKVLYENPQAHTQGATKGQIYILDKEHPENWPKAVGKIMATWQSDPDMNEIMKESLAVIAAVGGRNSHTMIVATEYGLIAISGIGNLDKLWDERKITIDAEAGLILDGWDYDLVEAGRSYNVRELGILPPDFYIGLNINSTQLAHKASPFRNKSDFYGVGLGRLELFLADLIGAAGEGLLRYDAYRIYSLIEKLDKGILSVAERKVLDAMLKYKGETEYLRPNVNKDNTISVFIDGREQIYKTGLEFYNAYIENAQNPRYNPQNPADLNLIKTFDELTKGYLLGEERYVNLMSGGIKSVVSALIVKPLELLEKAQSVQNTELRNKLLDLVDAYQETFEESAGALPTNELLKKVEGLMDFYSGKVSKKDIKAVRWIKQSLYRVFLFRLDDLKDDEYDKVPGSAKHKSRNPMEGYRGIGSFVDNPQVTRMQLKAIRKVVQLGAHRDANGHFIGPGKYRIGIFAPMVYDAEHVRQMNKICDEAGLTSDRILRGIMTETPQSVELAPFLEAGIDFTSNGWNDFTQLNQEVDRQNSAPYYNSITERSIQSIRALATITNLTKKWNKEKRLPLGLKNITNGFCGNWPAVDLVGALTLYLFGYDSASVTIPSIDGATTALYTMFDHLYGHDESRELNLPEDNKGNVDKEQIVKDLYGLIADKAKQEGLPKNLIDALPFLKLVLDNRNFNIYDQIDLNAKPEIKTDFAKGSISAFHLSLPFHYQLLAEYDKKESGNLFVKEKSSDLFEKMNELKVQRKKYESDFDKLKERSGKGEDVGKELDSVALHIQSLNKDIKDMEYKLNSIALRDLIQEYLKSNGYSISQKNVGKTFYIENLKNFWRAQLQEAQQKGEKFIIETSKEPADYLKMKLGGDRYELPKEPNPDLGNRGVKKILNPDRNIFQWELEAIKELRDEGFDNIALALSKVREPSEIDDVRLLLKESGLTDIPLGMVVNSPNNIFAYDYFLIRKKGATFLLLDREAKRELVEAKRGTEWDNVNRVLITDPDVDKSLADVTIPITKSAAAKFGATLYMAEKPTNEVPNIYAFNKIFKADTKSYNNFAVGFSDLVGAVKDLKDKDEGGKGAFVIKAEEIFKNAGNIAVLKEFKGATPDFKIAIWAEDEAELKKVMRIAGLADIVTIGLDAALQKLNEGYNIKFDHIVIISSKVNPEGEISKAIGKNVGLRVVTVDEAIVTKEAIKSDNVKVNPTTVLYGKATVLIFQNEPTVVEKYKNFINQQSAQIVNKEDYNKLLDLSGKISAVPLVKVTAQKAQEAVQEQATYEEVWSKV